MSNSAPKKGSPILTRMAGSIGLIALIALAAGAWIVHFHSSWVAGVVPKAILDKVAQAPPAADDSSAPDAQVPVHLAKVTRQTFHRFIEGYGAIAPRPPRISQSSGSAAIASPVSGLVAAVLCEAGRHVAKGDGLIQLDDTLAQAAVDQAAAALAQAQASRDALKATPRPQQLDIARLAVEKSQAMLEFAQKNDDRQKTLAAEQGTAGKNLEQADLDLASAKNDLAVNQNQLTLLQQSPTPQDLAQENAKVAQAAAAFASAKAQAKLLKILSPIDGTVMQVDINPGEAVDTTKTLVQIIDLDHLTVDLDLPAAQLPSLQVGLAALVIPDQVGGGAAGSEATGQIPGKVSFISPQIDAKAGTVQVWVDLDKAAPVRPGQTVRVRIIAEEHPARLAVPRESIVNDDDGNTIINVVTDDKAAHKKVAVGFDEDDLKEVTADGLKEGDTVVAAGAYGLPDGTKVKDLDEAPSTQEPATTQESATTQPSSSDKPAKD